MQTPSNASVLRVAELNQKLEHVLAQFDVLYDKMPTDLKRSMIDLVRGLGKQPPDPEMEEVLQEHLPIRQFVYLLASCGAAVLANREAGRALSKSLTPPTKDPFHDDPPSPSSP